MVSTGANDDNDRRPLKAVDTRRKSFNEASETLLHVYITALLHVPVGYGNIYPVVLETSLGHRRFIINRFIIDNLDGIILFR